VKKAMSGPSLSGQKWRNTHQATVDSILGPGVRTIRSQGSQFYNKDTWTARTFVGAFCEWARLNKENVPTKWDVEGWLVKSNSMYVPESTKGIVIAATPDDLPKGLSFALMGGGYHEAWHTEFSRRTKINVCEVWPLLEQHWKLIPQKSGVRLSPWQGLTGPLLTWSNIIEDIRIERLGCAKYPGATPAMEALQDLILDQETEGREMAEHRGVSGGGVNQDLQVVMGAFRDLGLGYETPKQKAALSDYESRSPGAWKFVTRGPLKPLLERAIHLTESVEDSLGSLWLAMEVVAAIANAIQAPPTPKPKPQPKKEEPKKKEPSEDDENEGEGEGSSEEGEGEEEEGEPQAQPEPQSGGEQEAAQQEIPDEDEEEFEKDAGSAKPPKSNLILYKVGDRATLKSGPHAGKVIEITRAGLPDEEGRQDLEFALVEEE